MVALGDSKAEGIVSVLHEVDPRRIAVATNNARTPMLLLVFGGCPPIDALRDVLTLPRTQERTCDWTD